MQEHKSIIICANPRSGSTLLCDLLASTGVAGNPGSFYRPESIPAWAQRLGVSASDTMDELMFERAYLSAILKEGRSETGMFGLRLMWDTVAGLVERLSKVLPDQPSNAALFERAFGRPFYVSLIRQDKLAQAVSLVRASQSGLWHLAADGAVRQGATESQPSLYDAVMIKRELSSLTSDDAAWLNWFVQQRLSPLQVTYESLARDPQSVLAGILTAIGHDPDIARNVEPKTSKMADEENERWIERYKSERA